LVTKLYLFDISLTFIIEEERDRNNIDIVFAEDYSIFFSIEKKNQHGSSKLPLTIELFYINQTKDDIYLISIS